jgi:hypothetical protein
MFVLLEVLLRFFFTSVLLALFSTTDHCERLLYY